MISSNVAVILGLSPTGLYAARELASSGVKLWGVDRDFGPAAWSKMFRQGFGYSIFSSQDELLTQLIRFAEGFSDKPVIIPTSDYFIELIGGHYTELSRYFLLTGGYESSANIFLDKLKFSKLCTDIGIDAPKVYLFETPEALKSIVSELLFPCILKPQLIHLAKSYLKGNKVIVVESASELLELSHNLPAETGGWFIQEVIAGTESNITLLAGHRDKSGNLISFTARKLRQYPPGFGSASLVASEECDETKQLSKKLVDAIDYQGIFGAEFKLDPRDNKLKVIEINPRPTLWFYISHIAGVEITKAAYFDLLGRKLERPLSQKPNVVWRYYLKDIYSKVFYKMNPGFIFEAPKVDRKYSSYTKCGPVFRLGDPKPFFAELYVFFKKLVKRLF